MAWFRGLELLFKWFNWAFKDDGTATDDFKALMGLTVGSLVAPTGLAATDGTYTNKVAMTWNLSVGASFYEVFRSLTNDSSAAVSLGTSTVSNFVDFTAAVNQRYFYFVKAKTATDSSPFSASDVGFSDNTGGGGGGTTGSQTFTDNGTWVVPAGVTTVEFQGWGGGGGGGGSGAAFCAAGSANFGGGGGGSGGYRKVKLIPTTPGETLTIIVGYPGQAGVGVGGGHASAGAGGTGGPSILRRSATDLASALGGGGGGEGACSATGPAGSAGSSGANSVGTLETATNGSAGSNATSGTPVGAGGAGAGPNNGQGAGGSGGALSAGNAGSSGQVVLTWPGPA